MEAPSGTKTSTSSVAPPAPSTGTWVALRRVIIKASAADNGGSALRIIVNEALVTQQGQSFALHTVYPWVGGVSVCGLNTT